MVVVVGNLAIPWRHRQRSFSALPDPGTCLSICRSFIGTRPSGRNDSSVRTGKSFACVANHFSPGDVLAQPGRFLCVLLHRVLLSFYRSKIWNISLALMVERQPASNNSGLGCGCERPDDHALSGLLLSLDLACNSVLEYSAPSPSFRQLRCVWRNWSRPVDVSLFSFGRSCPDRIAGGRVDRDNGCNDRDLFPDDASSRQLRQRIGSPLASGAFGFDFLDRRRRRWTDSSAARVVICSIGCGVGRRGHSRRQSAVSILRIEGWRIRHPCPRCDGARSSRAQSNEQRIRAGIREHGGAKRKPYAIMG